MGMAAASGAVSLIYEAVWTRRLGLVFGNTTPSTSATLTAFLGGVAIGSWIWGRVAGNRQPRSPLSILHGLQIATGFYGFSSVWVFQASNRYIWRVSVSG